MRGKCPIVVVVADAIAPRGRLPMDVIALILAAVVLLVIVIDETQSMSVDVVCSIEVDCF